MCPRLSLLKLLELPDAFGLTLLTIGLALCLAPYLGGIGVGTFTIPRVGPERGRQLKFIGPLFLLFSILIFAPAWPLICPASCVARSADGGAETEINFVNHSPKQITIIWHDDDGKEWENTRRTLDPGTELKQDTYLGKYILDTQILSLYAASRWIVRAKIWRTNSPSVCSKQSLISLTQSVLSCTRSTFAGRVR
jgi:hypothetical protein